MTSNLNLSTDPDVIVDELKKGWWVLLLRGIVTILLGLMVIANPGRTLVALTNVLAFFLLVDGILTLISSLSGRNGWSFLGAILMILAAVFALNHPIFVTAFATEVVLAIIGIGALAAGLLNIWAAFQHRSTINGWIWVLLNGILTVLFGLLVLFGNSFFVVDVLLNIVGIYMLIFGIALIILSFRVRSL